MATDSYALERAQRRNALNIMLWTTLVASLALGAFDIQFRTPLSVLSLFGLSLACVPLLVLNSRGLFRLSAALLSLMGVIVITLNIYDGNGVHDPGILAFPLFIMIGTLLFGKRAAPYFTLAAVLGVSVIIYLQVTGRIHPRIGPASFGILIPIVTLFVVAAIIVWVLLGNLERNVQRARDSEADLAVNYDLTLQAWATILEHRDRETEGHTQRVAAMTLQLARALGLSGQSLIDIRRGALLHDIGKMGMPDSILLKRSALTDEEWTVVREHPTLAHELLSRIRYLAAALDIPWCHHEHWDGTGYPRGLAGEQIPLAARIFAVVDVWDAVTSDRPYRNAWTKDQAREHIRSLSGSHFDPRVVRAFLDLDQGEAPS